ncbi:AarF/UbiB family protein [Bacillus sp. 2205SS5-2]|uniref:AarF/UbiB family protein n=1 Tax=Bacillus sp. 2205SS5-2 TaxID=3109031 RepID=UPI0030044745
MENFFRGSKNITKKQLTNFQLIGDGKDGEVYRLTEDKCVKYFFKEETQQKELEALQVGQASSVIPRIYEYGENYIVMEFVQGISFARHMKRQGEINEELTAKILDVLEEFKRIGFTRWDTEVRHLLMNEEGQFKVIDHKRAFSTSTTVPNKLLKGIQKFGLTGEFLNHVNKLKPELYKIWKKHK